MYFVQLANESEVGAYRRLLEGPALTLPWGRPFLGYLFFLVDGFERPKLELILENAREIDAVTGSKIAACVLVSKIPVALRYSDRPLSEESSVSWLTLRELIQKTELGHNRFHMLEGIDGQEPDFARPAYWFAEAFGVTDKMPCIVGFDSLQTEGSASFYTLRFPETQKELGSVLRALVHGLSGTGAEVALGLLNRLHETVDAIDECSARLRRWDERKNHLVSRGVDSEIAGLLSEPEYDRIVQGRGLVRVSGGALNDFVRSEPDDSADAARLTLDFLRRSEIDANAVGLVLNEGGAEVAWPELRRRVVNALAGSTLGQRRILEQKRLAALVGQQRDLTQLAAEAEWLSVTKAISRIAQEEGISTARGHLSSAGLEAVRRFLGRAVDSLLKLLFLA